MPKDKPQYPVEFAALGRAVELIGNQTKLAAAVGCKQQHVWQWVNRDGRVSAKFVLAVERATGVSRHELRPDLYPVD